eukprot:7056495-Alexandrium_andersonii.AAC.1
MDHLKHGPICKHAGAVLLALAAERCEEAPWRPPPSMHGWFLPSLSAEEAARTRLGARSEYDRGACEHPATGEAGAPEGVPVAAEER